MRGNGRVGGKKTAEIAVEQDAEVRRLLKKVAWAGGFDLEEVAGRKGKQPDGSSKTREAKLGCVFTQTTVDEKRRPVRDPDSTTFAGAIGTAEEFGWRTYAEARRRGLEKAARVAVLGDGVEWIRNLAETHFPGATQIVDLHHAREHVSDLIKILWPHDEDQQRRMRMGWWTALNENRVADFRAQGLFVGSGVVEAGCKTVIGMRLKQSGMEWSLRGANAVIALRCNNLSGRFEGYRESRTS
ncbi:MAG: hypothetical protein IT350_18000 [Deltaproteobacteria bacterium]|nr:hypothetical protein [Deltaproteobacteria bacterium]